MPEQEDLVFNVVWTGTTFTTMHPFARSVLAHSRSRLRFVLNGCPPEQTPRMEAFGAAHPERVVEVLTVSEEMIAHGQALDVVLDQRDDGRWFGLIDPDIKANGPWVDELVAPLAEAAAVTAGRELWSDGNVVPVGSWGVAGQHFYGQDGFVFGSPHLGVYDAAVLRSTRDRWGVGLGSAGPELSADARAHMLSVGVDQTVLDTGKIVNVLLQADGHRLVHHEVAQLVHIGGLSHFISPSGYITDADGEEQPEWARWDTPETAPRLAVTRYTASCLGAALAGEEVPPVPADAEPALRAKLAGARAEVVDLVDRYGSDPDALRAPERSFRSRARHRLRGR